MCPINIQDLNSLVPQIQSSEASIHVHYWGEIPNHFTHALHKHSFFEFCYVTNGDGDYLENGFRQHLYPGDLFLSKPDVWHQIEGGSRGIGLVFLAFELNEESSAPALLNGYRRLLKTEKFFIYLRW